jgi:ketosteroid isomerase-like protein
MRRLALAIAFSISTPISIRAQATAPARMPSVTLPAELDRVLRDYERLWKASDAAALAALFTDDGFALSNGKPPVRGRDAIRVAYSRVAGGDLRLRALSHATADTVGYIVGAYAFGADTTDVGKFVLALRRPRGGSWLIAADIDNSIRRPGGP